MVTHTVRSVTTITHCTRDHAFFAAAFMTTVLNAQQNHAPSVAKDLFLSLVTVFRAVLCSLIAWNATTRMAVYLVKKVSQRTVAFVRLAKMCMEVDAWNAAVMQVGVYRARWQSQMREHATTTAIVIVRNAHSTNASSVRTAMFLLTMTAIPVIGCLLIAVHAPIFHAYHVKIPMRY